MHHRAYKFRIYPTPDQQKVLGQNIGAARFIYNWNVGQRRESWVQNKESVGFSKSCLRLTELKQQEDFAWLNDVSNVVLQQSLQNVETAFSNFFKKKTRYPKFKSLKDSRQSVRYTTSGFRLKKGGLSVAKVPGIISVEWSREISSNPTTCTVSRNASGQWFASFLCEEEIQKLEPSQNRVGVDLGIETFATLSDGTKYSQPAKIRRLRKKLARLQKKHSRKQKGSKNRDKARRKVARVHQNISDIRKDFLHKLSTKLIRENQAIALEDLSVARMNKDRKLARLIGEQGWRDFRTMLEYKAEWYGREILIVDRYYPSSKTCSCCGRKKNLSLDKRRWTCECGVTHDRDINAATNILAAGQAVADSGADGRPTKNYVLRGSQRRRNKPKA